MEEAEGNDELCVRNIIVIMCQGTSHVSPKPLSSTFPYKQNVFL